MTNADHYKLYFCQCVMTLIDNKKVISKQAGIWCLEGWKVHRDAMGVPEATVSTTVTRMMDAEKKEEGDWNNVLYKMAREFIDMYAVDPTTPGIIRTKSKTSWQTFDRGIDKENKALGRKRSNIIRFPIEYMEYSEEELEGPEEKE